MNDSLRSMCALLCCVALTSPLVACQPQPVAAANPAHAETGEPPPSSVAEPEPDAETGVADTPAEPPAPREDARTTPRMDTRLPFLLSVHLEAKTARECATPPKGCKTDEEFGDMLGVGERFVASLEKRGLRATFEMHVQWLQRLPKSDRGHALVQSIIAGGHEIALHHHPFDHPDWDGYSDDPDAAPGQHKSYPHLSPASMEDYAVIVADFEATFAVTLETMATPEFEYDWRSTWRYRTLDETDPTFAEALQDPSGACAKQNGKTQTVRVPAQAYTEHHDALSMAVTTVPHTWFIGGDGPCQAVMAENVLRMVDALEPDELPLPAVVNLVFHQWNYGDSPEVEAEFDAFFDAVAERSAELVPMTIREFVCTRLDGC